MSFPLPELPYIPPTQRPSVIDSPNGFVCTSPWSSVDKTLFVDLKVNLASTRQTRNILAARGAARSKSNIHSERSFVLSQVATGLPASEFTVDCDADNMFTVVSSDRPVRLIVTTPNGRLDVGQITMFVLTSQVVKLEFANTANAGNAEVNLVQI